MIDIDKELRSLKTEYKPDEFLRRRTRSLVISETGRKAKGRKTLRRVAFVYSSALALVMVAALCVSLLTAAPAQAAGYYTIDINPSLTVTVDKNDIVISVTPENEDAVNLLEGIHIEGMQFEGALKTVVREAAQKDYLKENGNILVAHFGEGEGVSPDTVNSIVIGEVPAGNVKTLTLKGSMADYNSAKKSGKKAEIELLLDSAEAAGVEETDLDKIINAMSDKQKDNNKNKDKDNNNNKNKDKDNNNNNNNGKQE